MEEIFKEYGGSVAYAIVILFGGVAGTKYFPGHWAKQYKFIAFSAIVAILFILLEIFVQKSFKAADATKYLLTFCVVSVCYQAFLKKLFIKWGIVDDDAPQKP